MTEKQIPGSLFSPDGAVYATLVDENSNLISTSTSDTGYTKQLSGIEAPDGSFYMVLTDGSGNLV